MSYVSVYIVDLMTWSGFVKPDTLTEDQKVEAEALDDRFEAEEDIISMIESTDFHKEYPALAGIRKT